MVAPPLPLSKFASLASIVQALFWMTASGAAGGLMNVIIRSAAAQIDPLEIVFFRNLFALVFMLPFVARMGLRGLRTAKMGFYVLRAGVTFVSMVTWFIGIAMVPFATATALNFTAPLFATALAAIVLRERVRPRRWIGVGLGLFGVVVILRPFGAPEAGMFLIIASAATAAMGSITVKFLSRSESATAVVTHMVLYVTPISLIPALFVWQTPSPAMLVQMVVLGALGAVANFTLARALFSVDASALAPFEFLRLPYAALLGFAFFGETPDLWTWIGAAIIIASSLAIARREAREAPAVAVAG
ncbi:MAG: EamA/RhaT family transporter [Rhodospirillales bacterium]|nr:EamA/RhaT family transporter [Rhodospirillales bacterium]